MLYMPFLYTAQLLEAPVWQHLDIANALKGIVHAADAVIVGHLHNDLLYGAAEMIPQLSQFISGVQHASCSSPHFRKGSEDRSTEPQEPGPKPFLEQALAWAACINISQHAS